MGGAAGSRRIGLPTNSREEAGGLPSGSARFGSGGPPALTTGVPGLCGAGGRCGTGLCGAAVRIGTAGRF